MKLSNEVLSEEVVKVTDNDINYDVVFQTVRNSDYNIANGGKVQLERVQIYRLKKNGERGMKLTNIWGRAHAIAKELRGK